jgi:hypothetical protein
MPGILNRICVTLLAAAPFAASAAFAADLPVKAPPKPVEASGQFWAGVDYLAWTVKGDHLPALVTTSPVGGPPASAGVLGAPGTSVLFGNSNVDNGWRSGGRLRAGYWFDPQHSKGIEFSFFDLENASTGFAANSAAYPILAQPFFDPTINQQNARLSGFPGFITGSIAVNETSRLLGAGALYRQDLGSFGDERISALIGYRNLHASGQACYPDSGERIRPRDGRQQRLIQCDKRFPWRRSGARR